jgi:hypothetical protein
MRLQVVVGERCAERMDVYRHPNTLGYTSGETPDHPVIPVALAPLTT